VVWTARTFCQIQVKVAMAQKQWYLVTYDVRDAKRLRKVAKHLEGYGTRLQFSVFRCRLTERELERLRWELTRMTKSEDDLLIIGLCTRCGERVAKRSGDNGWAAEQATFEIV